VGSEFFHADGYIDGRTDRGGHDKANIWCSQFRKRA